MNIAIRFDPIDLVRRLAMDKNLNDHLLNCALHLVHRENLIITCTYKENLLRSGKNLG